MSVYTAIACGSWIIVGLVWLMGSFTAKPTAARPDRVRQVVAQALLVAGSALFYLTAFAHFSPSRFGHRLPSGFVHFLAARITPGSDGFGMIAVGLDLIGVTTAIWARLALGRNWSNIMTLKERHELVQTGPYGVVRHPIYAGLLLAILGTVMTIGALGAYLGLLSFLVGFLVRIQGEDALMAGQFPETHRAYRRRTKKLVPYVW